jgi:DNA-binding GntR family transcriptional regulator
MADKRRAVNSGLQARLAGRILIHARERGYGPGAWLSENALAQTFGVSRTPVRGALAVLSTRGLLNVVPRRGYVLRRAVRDQDLEPYADFASDDDRLVQRMAADRFAGVLPDSVSETDLMRRYGVARGALARVLNGLVQDNVI